MDFELSMALLTMWLASTTALFIAACMFLYNSGEAFHPHSIVMDRRHKYFSVVGANTVCKKDIAVKSVSAYFAPRGSTSDKIFTVLIVLCAVAGFLGSVRWRSAGDASHLEAFLCQVAFASMILVVVFEVPVNPQSFYNDKLLLTYWMMKKLHLQPYLDFRLSPTSQEFVEFIRRSDGIKHLFEEDANETMRPVTSFATFTTNFNLHALGASLYICCLTLAVILNDSQEQRVAYITGFFFVMFCALGYISGTYLPVVAMFKGMILIWNPFVREPEFLIKLQDAALDYHSKKLSNNKVISSSVSSEPMAEQLKRSPARPKRRSRRLRADGSDALREHVAAEVVVSEPSERSAVLVLGQSEKSRRAEELLSTHYNMRWAHANPKQYTRVLSHVMVTVELAAMITPIIAVGVQWMVALCESSDTPHTVFFAAFFAWCECLWRGDYECPELQQSCILFNSST